MLHCLGALGSGFLRSELGEFENDFLNFAHLASLLSDQTVVFRREHVAFDSVILSSGRTETVGAG